MKIENEMRRINKYFEEAHGAIPHLGGKTFIGDPNTPEWEKRHTEFLTGECLAKKEDEWRPEYARHTDFYANTMNGKKQQDTSLHVHIGNQILKVAGIAENQKNAGHNWFSEHHLPPELVTKKIEEAHEKALRYNEGKPEWSLIDFPSLEPLIEVLKYGSQKYATDNWKKEMPEKEILNSMMRHMVAILSGEIVDKESQKPHIGHIMANAMFYSYHYTKNGSSHGNIGSE
jgi:hypothetical protein